MTFPGKSISRAAFVAAFVLTLSLGASAETTSLPELRGAKALLQSWSFKSPAGEAAYSEASPSRSSDSAERELAEFRTHASELSADEAAQRWLGFIDRYRAASKPRPLILRQAPEQPPSFDAILRALPPTSAWVELSRQIKAKYPKLDPLQAPDLSLRLLAARLDRDAAEEAQIRALLLTRLPKRQYEFSGGLANSVKFEIDDLASRVDAFMQLLDQLKAADPDMLRYSPPIDIPDVVRALGAERAKPLILQALMCRSNSVSTYARGATPALISSILLEHINDLPRPRWKLVAHLHSAAVFEAMEKRFGAPPLTAAPRALLRSPEPDETSPSSEYIDAAAWHIIDLALAGDKAAAVKRALALPAKEAASPLREAVDAAVEQGRAAEAAVVLHDSLVVRPDAPWWEIYLPLAAKAGQSAEAVSALRSALEQPGLSAQTQLALRQQWVSALLADDQADAAAAELRKILTASDTAEAAAKERLSAAQSLLKLGVVLQRAEWTDEAAAAIKRQASEADFYAASSAAGELMDAKRFAAAETILDGLMKRAAAADHDGDAEYQFTSCGYSLLNLYFKAGRTADALTLLDEAPFWGASDIAELNSYEANPLLIVASALLEGGNRERALPLIERFIETDGGNDRGYELLLKAAPVDLEARLDTLAKSDPFQERPLIWKAEALRRAGKFAEAEKACRAAIAIDPSDGEEPAGDRLRVYAVLAEIRAAQGDNEQAETYRRVVRAIRLAEHADGLYRAGLLKRAIAEYNEALSIFSDAYCIQSRLAIRLAEAGNLKEAEAHYVRAYELMPDSFGRVESHCFGCEHAFASVYAQNLAERVFNQLANKNPKNPQVYYLLGYLRHEQERSPEALENFKKAAELDPSYLNAWKKILEQDTRVGLSIVDRDTAVGALLRLDPNAKHDRPDLKNVHDLRLLFEAADRRQRLDTASGERLYPLAKSAAVLTSRGQSESQKQFQQQLRESMRGISRQEIVQSNRLLRLLVALNPERMFPEMEE